MSERKMRVRVVLAAIIAGLPLGAAAQEAPRFARIFNDHAVLQRGRPIAIWGRAARGASVRVALGSSVAQARADRSGRWRVVLPAMTAGGPYRLTATGSGGIAAAEDIKIGDVYLCGGQSNMEFAAQSATGAADAFRNAANDDIRFVTIAHDSQPAPLDDLAQPAPWKVVTRDTVGEASAVCWSMARDLQARLKVPVGMVHASWGGTTVQSWMRAETLATDPAYAPRIRLLARSASDPVGAGAEQGRVDERWWAAHDRNAAAQRAWIAPRFDDAGWASLGPAWPWKASGAAELQRFDGVVWLRTHVELTEAQARAATRLKLGPVDRFDTTWVNGRRVGSSTTAWVGRDYAVPAGTFHAGRNVIVMRVLGGSGGGGFTGRADQRVIALADGSTVPLSERWRYRSGMPARDLEVPPSPWAFPTSLATLYNGMIVPLKDYGFTLAAWYQGESNAGEPERYARLLSLMMADWRRSTRQPDLPFVVAQLTAFGAVATRPTQSGWAGLRQAQADAVAGDQHAALVTTIDLGDRFDIHPSQKFKLGERMARAARAIAYREPITPGGPEASAIRREGGDLVVLFRHVNGGLRTYSADQAIGFERCDATGCSYVPAEVRGDTVVLRGANRPGTTKVRYAWADSPVVNLFDAEDLPATPFELAVRG